MYFSSPPTACYLDVRWYVERRRREAANLAQVLLALDSSDYHLLIMFCPRKTPWYVGSNAFGQTDLQSVFGHSPFSWIRKLLNGHLRMMIFIWLICWADQGQSASFSLFLHTPLIYRQNNCKRLWMEVVKATDTFSVCSFNRRGKSYWH